MQTTEELLMTCEVEVRISDNSTNLTLKKILTLKDFAMMKDVYLMNASEMVEVVLEKLARFVAKWQVWKEAQGVSIQPGKCRECSNSNCFEEK